MDAARHEAQVPRVAASCRERIAVDNYAEVIAFYAPVPSGAGRKTLAENLDEIELVAPTGFEPMFERRLRRRNPGGRYWKGGEAPPRGSQR